MSNHSTNNRRGMLLILVAGVLVFATIIFASLIDRVRHESALTNRVSINERLYQVATSIARIAVRKLQRDFETRDPEFGQKIMDAVFQEGKTGQLSPVDYTSVVRNLDVIKEIMTRFKSDSEWGARGALSLDVKYIVDLGETNPFSAPVPGLVNNPYERKGSIELVVTVSQMGVKKISRIRKDFILTRLLAPPFYRFTLFSHRGAQVDKMVANQTKVNEDGLLRTASKRPFICINRLVRNKRADLEGLDFRFNRADNIVKDIGGVPSFVRSGWIYLGGRGTSVDSKGDTGNLILNVVTGSRDEILKDGFGEFFHLHFNPSSSGWLVVKNWKKWLDDNIPGNRVSDDESRFMIVYVDYGFYDGLWDIPFRNRHLFRIASRMYITRTNENIDFGNSMHLFGTPALCTPTLVFGKVKRRYVRTYAFYLPQHSRIYPMRAFTDQQRLSTFFTEEIPDWYNEFESSSSDQLVENFKTVMSDKITLDEFQGGIRTGSQPLPGLQPMVTDWEPYLQGLKNIADPGGPDRSWADVVPRNNYVNDGPDDLCRTDYEFVNDEEIHYTGNIRQLQLTDSYLRDRMTYFIPGVEGQPTFLSKCPFFNNNFITESDGKNHVHLNQIIGYGGDLIIDMPLEVAKGGIIMADGKITIQAPVVNPYIEKTPDNPDAFGYITFISRKGITISRGASGIRPMQTVHGFFVSMNEGSGRVEVGGPMHIIGGVAADNIGDLVRNGCTIEWGFEPEELAGGRDIAIPDFYGLALSPLDVEIFSEE